MQDLIKIYEDGWTAQAIETVNELKHTGGYACLEPSGIAHHYCNFKENNMHTIMSYCFRRFGYPITDWDDQKELATWVIRTPMKGVFLIITPKKISSSFTYTINTAIATQVRNEQFKPRADWQRECAQVIKPVPESKYLTLNPFLDNAPEIPYWEQLPDTSIEKQVCNALWRTIIDLHRPVRVRDNYLTFDGQESTYQFLKYDEKTSECIYNYVAGYSKHAGYGINGKMLNARINKHEQENC
jgi:hypothetical protein